MSKTMKEIMNKLEGRSKEDVYYDLISDLMSLRKSIKFLLELECEKLYTLKEKDLGNPHYSNNYKKCNERLHKLDNLTILIKSDE